MNDSIYFTIILAQLNFIHIFRCQSSVQLRQEMLLRYHLLTFYPTERETQNLKEAPSLRKLIIEKYFIQLNKNALRYYFL